MNTPETTAPAENAPQPDGDAVITPDEDTPQPSGSTVITLEEHARQPESSEEASQSRPPLQVADCSYMVGPWSFPINGNYTTAWFHVRTPSLVSTYCGSGSYDWSK